MQQQKQSVAIIGGGGAGLLTAFLLQDDHNVTLYEAADTLGGHAKSIPIAWDGQVVHVETGFKYFFDPSYPVFMSVLSELGLSCRRCGASCTLCREGSAPLAMPPRTLRHVARLLSEPHQLRELLAMARFQRIGQPLLDAQDWSLTFQDFVQGNRFDPELGPRFLFPLIAASWGAPLKEMIRFPAYDVLKVIGRGKGITPSFYELDGGSSTYIRALVAACRNVELLVGCAVENLTFERDKVVIDDAGGARRSFDQVVLATSSRDAARLLGTDAAVAPWRDVLGAFRHFDAHIVIHSDESFMPASREDWSTVNTFYDGEHAWMTEWSGWRERASVFRTWLPAHRSPPRNLHHEVKFHHLLVTPESRALQRRIESLQGTQRIWATGMYATDVDNHESAVASALRVAKQLAPSSQAVARLERRVNSEKARVA